MLDGIYTRVYNMETISVPGCPPLRGPRNQPCSTEAPVFVAVNVNVDHLLFDTCNTSVGTLVRIGCVAPTRAPSTTPYLLCQANGAWNGTVPHCPPPTTSLGTSGSADALSTETLIIIGVVCGFAALVLLIILTLSLVYFLTVKRANKHSGSLDLPETNFYSTNPLAKHRTSAMSNYYHTEINPIYSTRLWRTGNLGSFNPQLYTTVGSRPSIAPSSHPRPPPYPQDRETWSLSDHPSDLSFGERSNTRSRPPMDTLIYNSIRWNPHNMKWHDNFNYVRDGRLPRYHMDERGLYRGSWAKFY